MKLYDELYFEITLKGQKSELVKFIRFLKSGELDDFFEMKSDRRLGNDTEYVLDAVKDCGIVSAKLIVSSGGIVRSGIFIMEDGTEVAVKVKSMKKAEERNPSFFSPDRKFSSDWIVTDLR